MFFKQIKHHGDNFSYVIADERAKEACVVDPSFNADAIVALLLEQGSEVKYIVNTHSHGDHTAGNSEIAARFQAKVVAHENSTGKKDIAVTDGSKLKIGEINVEVIHTPGHTDDSICLLVDNRLLTGDTLFVGECGRTDLPGGDPEKMYHSLFGRLLKLNAEIEIYPGHDYGSRPHSTIGTERKTNYTLQKRTLKEFIEFMQTP